MVSLWMCLPLLPAVLVDYCLVLQSLRMKERHFEGWPTSRALGEDQPDSKGGSMSSADLPTRTPAATVT